MIRNALIRWYRHHAESKLQEKVERYSSIVGVEVAGRRHKGEGGPGGGIIAMRGQDGAAAAAKRDIRASVLATSTNGTVWDPRNQGCGRAGMNSLRVRL